MMSPVPRLMNHSCHRFNLAVLISLALQLSGCGNILQSTYHAPSVNVPAQWIAPSISQTATEPTSPALINDQWWQVFNDPQLNALINQALNSNSDLAIAALKVRIARMRAGIEDTKLAPNISGGMSANSAGRNLTSGNISGNASYGAQAALSYEVDLWGKIARTRDAAHWEAEATELDRQNAALVLIYTTADLYWRIARDNQIIKAAEQNITYTQNILDLARVKYKAGASSGLDIIQAEQNLAVQKGELGRKIQQREQHRNALAVLFDQAPQNRTIELPHLPETPLPIIPIDIPAKVLARRPDLRAAETRLRSSLANVDAKKASFYPTLNLNASVNANGPTLSDILKNPIGALSASLALPFLQWRQTQLEINISKVEYEKNVAEFRKALYQALVDVEDTFSAHIQGIDEGKQHALALGYAKRAEQLAEIRYRAGQTSIKEWLDQQSTKRAAEITLAENRYQQLSNLMKLYQALGGNATANSE